MVVVVLPRQGSGAARCCSGRSGRALLWLALPPLPLLLLLGLLTAAACFVAAAAAALAVHYLPCRCCRCSCLRCSSSFCVSCARPRLDSCR